MPTRRGLETIYFSPLEVGLALNIGNKQLTNSSALTVQVVCQIVYFM